ncbi:MAG TPA: DMT family transporter [Syntrophomonadaceae bacterium]|nr:DMT family transporter [Syntrophomonadaceae bacterium]
MQFFLGRLYLAGAFILAGSSVVAARYVSGRLGVFTISAASLFLALLALLPISGCSMPRALHNMNCRDWIAILFQAACGMFLFRIFLLNGLRYTSASEAGLLTGAAPALTALLAASFLREPLYKTRVFGIISTVAGILLIQGMLNGGSGLSQQHLMGNLLVLAAAMCESLFNVLSRFSSIRNSLSQNEELNPIVQTTLVTGVALLLCLGPALTEHPGSTLITLGSLEWLALLWYGLVVTALGYILWYAGITRCDASVAAAFSGLMPFTSLCLSVALLGEHPFGQQWSGGAMVVLGMIFSGVKPSSQSIELKRLINLRH